MLEDENVSVDEAKDIQKEKEIGGEGDRHQRHQSDQLESIDQSPERLHRGLARKDSEKTYRQH